MLAPPVKPTVGATRESRPARRLVPFVVAIAAPGRRRRSPRRRSHAVSGTRRSTVPGLVGRTQSWRRPPRRRARAFRSATCGQGARARSRGRGHRARSRRRALHRREARERWSCRRDRRRSRCPTSSASSGRRAKRCSTRAASRYGAPTANTATQIAPATSCSVIPRPARDALPDTTVTVVVSKGHAPVEVPDVPRQVVQGGLDGSRRSASSVKRGNDVLRHVSAEGAVIELTPATARRALRRRRSRSSCRKGPDSSTCRTSSDLRSPRRIGRLDASAPRRSRRPVGPATRSCVDAGPVASGCRRTDHRRAHRDSHR